VAAKEKLNLYQTLDVGRGATKEAIRRAYRRASRQAHPDAGGSAEKFAAIVLARDVLSDDKRREQYDRDGTIGEAPVDNPLTRAMELAMRAVDHVIGVIVSRDTDPGQYDLIGDSQKFLDSQIREVQDKLRAGRAAAKKLRVIGKRFSAKKNHPERIGAALLRRAEDMERNIELGEKEVADLKLAYDIVGQHNYDWSSPADPYASQYPTPMVGYFIHGP
jgi:curved DNA-binding protein CbpA